MFAEIKEVVQWSSVPLLWLSGKANRKRLSGARIEIIAMIMCSRPTPSLLMVQSVYDDCWMPAQEGVNYRESFLAAVARGLSEECDVSIFDREGQLKSNYYLRDIEYVDTLWLPYERWGERAVVGGSEDNFFSQIQMRKKAYWAAFIIVDQMKAVQGRPNLREVNRVEWKTFDNAATLIRGNRSDKAELLFRCLQKGMQHLVGSRRADEWLPELAD